jgi:hypothetical protein
MERTQRPSLGAPERLADFVQDVIAREAKSQSDLSDINASSHRSRRRRRQVPTKAISWRTDDLLGCESVLVRHADIATVPRHVPVTYSTPTSRPVGAVIATNNASTIRTTKNSPAAIKRPGSILTRGAAPGSDGRDRRAEFIPEIAVMINLLCSHSCFRGRFIVSVIRNNLGLGNFFYHCQL